MERKFSLSLLIIIFSITSIVYAADREFEVPDLLRPRVNFWIDVFTRYDKDQVLIHHRDFPQAVFGVIDFRSQRKKMSDRAFSKYRERVKNQKVKLIENSLKNVAKGKYTNNPLDKLVKEVMEIVPGRTGKYRKAYQENLIRTQTGIRDKFRDSLKRSGRYLHILEQIFKEHGLPIELTRLPYIESSFDYRAYSSVGAAGIWQFMPATGRSFGMKITSAIDERRDIVEATQGAAKYLKSAYKSLGNWGLALTSYNHGVAGVKRKIKKLNSNDMAHIIERPSLRLFGFASTNFWPEFLAALEVHNNYSFYFPGLVKERPRYIVGYKLPHSFSFKHLVNTLKISEETLQEYNYALSKNTIKGQYNLPKGYVLKLPAELKAQVSKLTKPERGIQVQKVYGGSSSYKVVKGDTLIKIANRYKTSVSKLKSINKLRTNNIYVGQRLKLYSSSGIYVVKRGDTLSGIASRHRTSSSSLKKVNNLRSSKIYIGQKLKLGNATAKSTFTSKNPKIYHNVKYGENLWLIAKKYKTDINSIKKLNNLKVTTLKVGQRLRVR